jgi:hypothetical protein
LDQAAILADLESETRQRAARRSQAGKELAGYEAGR